jgi:hypothetical protein
MAFADYFYKNEQAGALLLKGHSSEVLRQKLSDEVIALVFDANATTSAEGRSSIDLMVRLLARLYPSLAFIPQDVKARDYARTAAKLATEINPNIDLCQDHRKITRAVICGQTRFQIRSKQLRTRIYIGSDRWVAKISAAAPPGSGRSNNPFGAGAAACVGAANLFRAVFSKQLTRPGMDTDLTFSVLDLNPMANKPANPRSTILDFGTVHLVGAGAIGNGFLWAASRTASQGAIHIVDSEVIEESNLQRYVMTDASHVGKLKVDLAASWISKNGVASFAHHGTWDDFFTKVVDRRIACVAVAVDTPKARIQIQASLPKQVFNSWTQAGESGNSRHTFDGAEACLACLYFPTRTELNFDEIVRRALRLPDGIEVVKEVRRRLEKSVPTELEFLEYIAKHSGVPLARLTDYQGKPLRDLYVGAICGGAVLEFGAAEDAATVDVPMAFQSALSGILLAADVVASHMWTRRRLPTITQIDLLRKFPTMPSHIRLKRPKIRCICTDADFVTSYNSKYRSAK